MHVDLGVEIARDRKDAIDLRTRIGVEIRRGADGPRAAGIKSSSVPGLLVRPSCGNTQSSTSIAQA
jgi:hypothetical protein